MRGNSSAASRAGTILTYAMDELKYERPGGAGPLHPPLRWGTCSWEDGEGSETTGDAAMMPCRQRDSRRACGTRISFFIFHSQFSILVRDGPLPIAGVISDRGPNRRSCRGGLEVGGPSAGRRCPAGTSDIRGGLEAVPDLTRVPPWRAGRSLTPSRRVTNGRAALPTRADQQGTGVLARLNRLLGRQQVLCHHPQYEASRNAIGAQLWPTPLALTPV
jgi:hypothetical protein